MKKLQFVAGLIIIAMAISIPTVAYLTIGAFDKLNDELVIAKAETAAHCNAIEALQTRIAKAEKLNITQVAINRVIADSLENQNKMNDAFRDNIITNISNASRQSMRLVDLLRDHIKWHKARGD